jgi:hypothetical protein
VSPFLNFTGLLVLLRDGSRLMATAEGAPKGTVQTRKFPNCHGSSWSNGRPL